MGDCDKKSQSFNDVNCVLLCYFVGGEFFYVLKLNGMRKWHKNDCWLHVNACRFLIAVTL